MRARQSERTRRKAVGFRPQLEMLEDRICPSFSFGVEGHTLLITGDQTNNTLQIRSVGQAEINVIADEVALKDWLNIENVVVHLGDASNTVEAKLAAGIAVSVDAGNGANTIDVEVAQDESPMARKADNSIIAIHTGSGLDTVTAKVVNVPDVNVTFVGGGDSVTAKAVNAHDSTVSIDTGGGDRSDSVAVKVDFFVPIGDPVSSAGPGTETATPPPANWACSVNLGNGALIATVEGDGTPEFNGVYGDQNVALKLDQSESVALKLDGAPGGSLMLSNEEAAAMKFEGRPGTALTLDQTESVALKLEGSPGGNLKLHNEEAVTLKSDNPGTTAAAIDFLQTESVALKIDGSPSTTLTLDQSESVAMKFEFRPSPDSEAATLRIADSGTVDFKCIAHNGAETVAVKVTGTETVAMKLDGVNAVALKFEDSDTVAVKTDGEAVALKVTESDAVTYNGTFLTGAATVALKLDGTEAEALQVILLVVKQQDGTFLTGTETIALKLDGTEAVTLRLKESDAVAVKIDFIRGAETVALKLDSIEAMAIKVGRTDTGMGLFEVSGTAEIALTASSITGTGSVFAEVAAFSDFQNPGPWWSIFLSFSTNPEW